MRISKKGGLLLLGLGALAIYKYNKMSAEERTALKDKAKKFYEDNLSPLVKNALGTSDEHSVLAQDAPLK